MRLPETADIFSDSIITNSRLLAERGFWDIQTVRLEKWYNQFCGTEERFFASCLLHQVIFRTRRQFEAGLRALFRSNLRGNIFAEQNDLHLIDALRKKENHRLRLVPVICESDPPTKSGPLVIRRLQRILQLNQKWMCWPWQAAKELESGGANAIIFVDDFLGSGNQFVTFFKQWKFDVFGSDVTFYYVPVVAHGSGIKHLLEELPELRVINIELLDDTHGFFSDEIWRSLGQGTISAEDAQAWYMGFCESQNIAQHGGVGPLGYGNLALTFGFSHSTPNNTLPILWSETPNWKPLLER